VPTLFKKFRQIELGFCIGNSIQIGIILEIEDPKISICIEFPIEDFSAESGIFSYGFCTFHTVKSKLEKRFPNFWILVKAEHLLFSKRLGTSPNSQRLRMGQLFKTIDEIH
jgi:hypothetical protein